MKWFKHDADARNDVKIKLLKANFGAEGYGVYFQLLEIIAENVKEGNYDEWGQVESIHNMNTLAMECGVSANKLRKILEYCNEINLLHKIDDKLTAPNILDRLADYSTRKAREADKFDVSQRKNELIRRVSGQKPDSVRSNTEQTPASDTPKNRREENRTEEKRIYTAKSWDDKKPSNDELQRIADKYQVSIAFVESKWDDLVNWCAARGKDNYYKDWSRALADWVKRDSIKLNNERRGNARRIAVIPIPE